MSRVLAFDFGALQRPCHFRRLRKTGELSYREVHRFENNPPGHKDGHFRWDFEDLLANVRLGAPKGRPGGQPGL